MIDKARYADGKPKTMWNLLPKKKIPPTRVMRWCCSELKEWGGRGRTKITGVRLAESESRKRNQGVITIQEKPNNTKKLLEKIGLDFRVNAHGGIVMNLDNDIVIEDLVKFQMCFAGRTKTVNPIVNWTDRDVWDFLHHYGCEGNPLYQCGEKRIGCVGCPMQDGKGMKKDFAKYPEYKRNYIRAFDRMLIARKEAGRENKINWKNGEGVFRWWIGEDPDQYTMFDENEVFEIMQEIMDK